MQVKKRLVIVMKRKWIIALIFLLLLSITGFIFTSGKKPFKNLEPAEIVSATVWLTPPDKTIQIVEIKELVDYLNDVVIYHKDNSYTEYTGQGVTFTLTMTDGTQTKIMAYNPFLIINDVGYKTKYAPCETLNRYANRLLNEEDAVIILENPPMLGIISEETYHDALLGTYLWQRKNKDGSVSKIKTDNAHPLDCKNFLLQFETEAETAMLRFTEEPDEILSVRCWSDEYWSVPSAKSETVTVDGYEIKLKPGGYIYEVKAKWNIESGYGGIAYYSFYVKTLVSYN